MALYHLDVRYFSRRRGQSVVGAASYRSGQRLYDHYYGEVHDFTSKGGIIHSGILLPPNAPLEYSDRETLWNSVEYAERRKDSRLAREVEGALQIELPMDVNISLVERYVAENFVAKGMIADIAIHDKGIGNPHFHCLLTTRYVTADGFGDKNRDWDKKVNVDDWRREWAAINNRELIPRGFDPISHESYAIQNFGRSIKRIPTRHLGHRVQMLDRIGLETDRIQDLLEIIEYNERHQERELSRARER